MQHNQLIASVFVFGLTTACSIVEEPFEVGKEGKVIGCPASVCGVNTDAGNETPLVGELHLFPGVNHGLVGSGDTKLIDFFGPDGQNDWLLQIEDGELIAIKNYQVHEVHQLHGSRLRIEDTEYGETYDVTLFTHKFIASWTSPPYPVPHYMFMIDDPLNAGSLIPLCEDGATEQDIESYAVIVSNERYDWETNEVSETGLDAAGWFNIACYGYGLYKTKMMGYEPEPNSDNPHDTTPDQRQATIRMMLADYCGTGDPFTVSGTNLAWENEGGWSLTGVTPGSATFEAFWTHDGAACLDDPRLGSEVIQEIIDTCASVGKVLQTCESYDGEWEWMTENPE